MKSLVIPLEEKILELTQKLQAAESKLLKYEPPNKTTTNYVNSNSTDINERDEKSSSRDASQQEGEEEVVGDVEEAEENDNKDDNAEMEELSKNKDDNASIAEEIEAEPLVDEPSEIPGKTNVEDEENEEEEEEEVEEDAE